MIENILQKYESKDRSNLIAILQDVQIEFGYLSRESITEIAYHFKMPLSRVYGVATFYNMFRLSPLGKHIVKVCRGTACHVKNSINLLQTLEDELKINAGETTTDNLFTLETVACMGACSIAPVMNIDDDYYGRLTVKDIPNIIKRYN